jgi:hypothetical protein
MPCRSAAFLYPEEMPPSEIVNLTGLVLNVIGTIAVGIAASKYMLCVQTALLAAEVTTAALLDPSQNVPHFVNLDKQRDKYFKKMGRWTALGLGVVVLGFLLQLIASPSVWKLLPGQS